MSDLLVPYRPLAANNSRSKRQQAPALAPWTFERLGCAASDHYCAAEAQPLAPTSPTRPATVQGLSPGVPRGAPSTSTQRETQPPARKAKWQRPCALCLSAPSRGQRPCSSRTTPSRGTRTTNNRRGPRTGGRRPCARDLVSATPRRRARAWARGDGDGHKNLDLEAGAAPAASRLAPARAP